MKTFKTTNRFKSDDGFTLIDMAIALLVIGLLVAPIVHSYHLWEERTMRTNTTDASESVNNAIIAYYHEYKRYPCPADPTLGPNDANYGLELRNIANPYPAAQPCLTPGTIATPNGFNGASRVFIGAVPFKTLKLQPEQATDSWDNKLVYAVTEGQTDHLTFAGGAGEISLQENAVVRHPTILDPAASPDADMVCMNVALLTPGAVPPGEEYIPVNNVHYVVLSLGEDGAGAYADVNAPAPRLACPAAGAQADAENCDNDAVFIYDPPTENACHATTVAGANYYDDLFLDGNISITQTPTKMWDTGANPNDVGSASGYIGLGNENPQAELDLVGNLLAENETATDVTKTGQAIADDFCKPDGNNCFKPESIAGNDPRMSCNNGMGMAGIGSGKAKCQEAILSNVNAAKCPNGQYLLSISSTGAITCATP